MKNAASRMMTAKRRFGLEVLNSPFLLFLRELVRTGGTISLRVTRLLEPDFRNGGYFPSRTTAPAFDMVYGDHPGFRGVRLNWAWS